MGDQYLPMISVHEGTVTKDSLELSNKIKLTKTKHTNNQNKQIVTKKTKQHQQNVNKQPTITKK